VEKVVAIPSSQEEPFIRGQAGGVGEQHAHGNFATAMILFGLVRSGNKFRNDSCDGGVEIDHAAFIEDHCHACCGNHFGKGGEIEERGRGYKRRVGIVCKPTQSFKPDQAAIVGYGNRRSGEGVFRDGIVQDGKRERKNFVLTLDAVRRRGRT